LIVAVLLLGGWFVFGMKANSKLQVLESLVQQKIETLKESAAKPGSIIKTGNKTVLSVPFAPQAPFGGWKDDRQQDGCEEASAIMAMAWVKNEKVTLQKTLDQIIAISAYEQKNYGSYNDTSAEDTAKRIFNGYFGYSNIKVVHNITTEDIKKEIAKGNLVVVPVDGQRLYNPFFAQPGPERHMIVVKGYNSAKNQFITNDPGTKHGESYIYSSSVLEGALRDYVTGHHAPIINIQKAMIVVYPK